MVWWKPTTWGRPQDSVASTETNITGDEGSSSWDIVRGAFGAESLSTAGAHVTPTNAMRVSAVYASVRLLAGAIASLPVHIYQTTADGKERVDNPLWWLLNQEPVPGFTAASFWEFTISQILLRGDSFAYIARNRGGQPIALIPLKRSDVMVKKVYPDNPREPWRLAYYVSVENGYFGVPQEDMLHFPGLGFDGCASMSVIKWGARDGTGIALRADEYAGRFFSNGLQSQHALKAQKRMTQEQQDDLRAAWQAKYAGGNSYGIPLILTEGMEVHDISMSAHDAQLLETRKWQIYDIARAFGVPPHMIGETEKSTSWGSGIEQMGIGFVVYTLQPHLTRMKQELNRKLFPSRRYMAEHSTAGLMRGDHVARAKYYQAALGGTQAPAWMTPNEVRKLENLPAVEDGDRLSKPDPAAEPSERSNLIDEDEEDNANA